MISWQCLLVAAAVILLAAIYPAVCLEQAPLVPNRGPCSQNRVRKEYRDMTASEWSDFVRALNSVDFEVDRWTRMHLEHVGEAHGVASFFPWHRCFLMAWENRLRDFVPNVTVPYWDWTSDWSDPLSASLFTLLPVRSGPSGDCKYKRTVPQSHCLTRNYTARDFTTFYSFQTIQRIQREAKNYERLWRQIEPAPHGILHAAIGGAGGDMTQMHSPNDPMFWFHHANLDRMWAEWQDMDPTRLADYSGSGQGNKQVRLTDSMSPFQVTAADAVDYHRFCYTYAPYSGWQQFNEDKANNRNQRRLRAEAVEGLLPQPIPDHFIAMHGLNATEVREQEAMMRESMRQDLLGGNDKVENEATRSADASIKWIAFITLLVLVLQYYYY